MSLQVKAALISLTRANRPNDSEFTDQRIRGSRSRGGRSVLTAARSQRFLFSLAAGNKADLHAQRQVLFEDACTLAENNGVLAALETSAKEAQNVDAAFILMARELLARNGMPMTEESVRDIPQFMLSGSSHPVHGAGAFDKKCGC